MRQLVCVLVIALFAVSSVGAATGADYDLRILPASTTIPIEAEIDTTVTVDQSVDVSVVLTTKIDATQGWSLGVQLVPAAGATMTIAPVRTVPL